MGFGVPQVEYGHLHKFIVSIGLVLLGSAAAVHWAVIRETATLTITRNELDLLTPIARDALIQRQAQLATITDWYQWFCLLLAIAGLACVLYGISRWRPQQRQSDEVTRAEAAERVRVLTLASQEELDLKSAEEAASAFSAPSNDRESPPAPAVSASEDPSGPEPSRHIPSSPGLPGQDFHESYRRIESRLTELFKDALQAHYLVRDGVRFAAEPQWGGRVKFRIADLVAVSTSSNYPDLVFEFKYAPRSTSQLDRRVREARAIASELGRAMETSQPGRRTVPVAVVVVDDDATIRRIEGLPSGSNPNALTFVLTVAELESTHPADMWERIRASLESLRKQ